jgi:hypothetical protein
MKLTWKVHASKMSYSKSMSHDLWLTIAVVPPSPQLTSPPLPPPWSTSRACHPRCCYRCAVVGIAVDIVIVAVCHCRRFRHHRSFSRPLFSWLLYFPPPPSLSPPLSLLPRRCYRCCHCLYWCGACLGGSKIVKSNKITSFNQCPKYEL